MENILDLLKQIKCKKCNNNLEIKVNYEDNGYDLYCSCNYINYFFSTYKNQLYISSNNNIIFVLIVIHLQGNELYFYLNSCSDKCFDALNTGLDFKKTILFNISDIEKTLNIYSTLESNLIFK
jgi:hypothetical protein